MIELSENTCRPSTPNVNFKKFDLTFSIISYDSYIVKYKAALLSSGFSPAIGSI